MTNIGGLTLVPASTYEAYGGPETGGVGVQPQSPDPLLLERARRMGTLEESVAGKVASTTSVPSVPREPAVTYPTIGGLSLVPAPGAAEAAPQAQRSMLARTTIVPKGQVSNKDIFANEARELYRELTAPRPLADDRSSIGNIAQSHMTEVGNALLAAPSVAGNFLTYPLRRAGLLPGQQGPGGRDTPLLSGTVPYVTTEDIGARLGSLNTGKTVEQSREDIDLAEAERRARYPVSTTIGDYTGIAQELALGRAPFGRGLRKREVKVEKKIDRGVPMSRSILENRANWKTALEKSIGWPSFNKVFGRVGEAGIEGATISILDQGDPLETAAWTAGAQAVFGGGLQAAQHKFLPVKGGAGRVANLAVNAAILSSLFYLADVAMPGEARDYEAQRAAAQKILWGYGLGAGFGLVSARARSGQMSAWVPGKQGPAAMDAIAGAPRNMMQGLIQDYIGSDEGGKASFKQKIEWFRDNIDKLDEKTLRDITAAFNADKERFKRELDKIVPEGLGQ